MSSWKRGASSLLLVVMTTLTASCGSGVEGPSAGGTTGGGYVPDAAERAEVLDVMQVVFDAIEAGEAELLLRALDPAAKLVSVRPDPEGSGFVTRHTSVEEMARSISGSTGHQVERMWDAEVRVDGPLASVWAPYDFYRDGSFSHCGVDAAHLVRNGEGWRIVSLTWNALQTPACTLHPAGPPEG